MACNSCHRWVASHFRGRVRKIMTLNEPSALPGAATKAAPMSPATNSPREQMPGIYHILCLSHSAGQWAIKAELGDKMTVGAAVCGNLCYPSADTPAGREAACKAAFDSNRGWISTFSWTA